MPRQPFPFQVSAIEQLSKMNYALLAYDMGLGKSKIALDAFKLSSGKKAILICKASLISHWQQECSLEDIPSYAYHGPKREGILKEFLKCKYGVLIISFNLISQEKDILPKQLPCLPVIIDEAHLLVNAHSRSVWGVWSLHKYKVWLLTGTPLMNDVEDMFTTLSLLKLYKGNLSSYRQEFMVVVDRVWNSHTHKEILIWEPQDDALERIHTLIEPLLLKKSGDILKPSIVRKIIKVVLDTKKQEQVAACLKELQGDDIEQTLANITAWRLIASYPNNYEDSRFQAITEICKGSPNQKIFIVTSFETVAKRLEKLMQWAGIKSLVISGDLPLKKRDKLIQSVQDDSSIQVLIGVNQACREGLNLPFIDILVWYDGAWNDGGRHQIEDRIRRVTSRFKRVTIYTLDDELSPEKWMENIRNKKEVLVKALNEGKTLQKLNYPRYKELAKLEK